MYNLPPRPSATSILLLFILAACAAADTLHVNNISGSDLNDGAIAENQGDGSGPLRSITGALKRAQRGDRIVLANSGKSYEECITLQGPLHSGSSFAPFVIVGNGATLDGTATVPPHKWEHIQGDVFRFVPERAGFQQLFLDGEFAERLRRLDRSYLTTFLKPKQWCLCNGAIQFAADKGKSVHNYDLRYAKHRVGITLYDVENVVIHDLNIRGFQLDGINAHDNAMDCILSEVTSTENGRSGVTVDGASRVRIVRSELQDNGTVQLNSAGWSTTHLNRSKLVANDTPVWTRHVNAFGRGARVYVDNQLQLDTQGWNSEENQVNQDLKNGLDELEEEVENEEALRAGGREPIAREEQPDSEFATRPGPNDEPIAEEANDAATPVLDLEDPFSDDGLEAADELDGSDLFDEI